MDADRRSARKVLVVDDEPPVRAVLCQFLESRGLEPLEAADGAAALEIHRREQPAVVLLDVEMPGLDGMAVLSELRAMESKVAVIMLTAHGDVPRVVEAMRLGAYDFLAKPFDLPALGATIARALERDELLARVDTLEQEVAAPCALTRSMGPSAAIRALIENVDRVAPSDFTVLIQGETGTGKELVARAIHARSPRRERPFIALDCGAMPETLVESQLFGHEKGAFTGAERRRDGHFQLAAGGTLFLDEIGNLPVTAQAKLLRALQERAIRPLGASELVPVDVRIVAASNVSLDGEMRAGRFKEDLYYRIAEFPVRVPSLRERRDDIPYLATRFATTAAMELQRPVHAISDAAVRMLVEHPWPGNVRQLRNVIRHAVLSAEGVILPEHLAIDRPALADASAAAPRDPCSLGTLKLRDVVAEAERSAIREALRVCRGNQTQAARALGIDSKTVYVKMKRYRLSSRELAVE